MPASIGTNLPHPGETNFSLNTEQKVVWSRKLWRETMARSFFAKFLGKDHNAMIQHVTELTKDERGDRAIMTLIAELGEDGIVGDAMLEGNEESINAYDFALVIDQLRHANRSTGRMNDQKSIVNFRSTSKSVLANWYADRLDQMAFLTMSGIPFTMRNDGRLRTVDLNPAKNLSALAFGGTVATDPTDPGFTPGKVTMPTVRRHLRWNGTAKELESGSTDAITSADRLSYEALVRTRAYMKEEYIRGIPNSNLPTGDFYHVFVTPSGMADLRLDEKYRQNVLYAANRGSKNEVFTGAMSVMADGLIIHEYHHVFDNRRAAAGDRWGSDGNVAGQRVIIGGAQAMGFADIGTPIWTERDFDYGNKHGIAIAKILGLVKPVYENSHSGTKEDFGLCVLDTAI